MYWLRARIHPTWHFTAFCIGIILGVVASLKWQDNSWLLLLLGTGLFCLAMVRHRRFMLGVALAGGLLIGVARGSVDQHSLAQYSKLYGKHLRLSGIVADDIDTNARGQAIVHLTKITNAKHEVSGKLWVSLDSHESKNIQRGDHIEIDGVLENGFGTFAGSMYLPQIVNVSREQPGDLALNVRDSFANAINRAVKEPEASLGIGFLLGQKRGLPEQLIEALQIAGLTHIVVASGYNLTILVRLARRLFERISKYMATLVSALLIVAFIAMTGLSPSMTRAGLVAGLGLWAWYYGRRFHPGTLLVFAMAATVLWNPSYVWGDIGWALSFAAFAGVMIVAPLLQTYFYGSEKPPFVMQLIGETLAAQLATAPIILLAFGQFSNVALFSNLLILPFIPLAMLLVAIAGAGTFLFPALAPILGWPAEKLLQAMVWVIEKTASVEWAQSHWQLSIGGVAVWYLLIVAACAYILYRTRFKLYQTSIVE